MAHYTFVSLPFLEHSEIEWLFSCFGILPPFYK